MIYINIILCDSKMLIIININHDIIIITFYTFKNINNKYNI